MVKCVCARVCVCATLIEDFLERLLQAAISLIDS